VPHPWFGAAVQALQTLNQKFDVADAARMQLDVNRVRIGTTLAGLPSALLRRREFLVQPFAR